MKIRFLKCLHVLKLIVVILRIYDNSLHFDWFYPGHLIPDCVTFYVEIGAQNDLSVFAVAFYSPFVLNGHMTETIKVEVNEELARRFRKRAMERYGYKKGSMKKALETLMEDFTRRSRSEPDWGSMRGAIKDEYKGVTSVELQHSIWRIKNDYHNRHKHLR